MYRWGRQFVPTFFPLSVKDYGASVAMVKIVLRIFSRVSRSSPLPTHFPSAVVNCLMGCLIYGVLNMVIG